MWECPTNAFLQQLQPQINEHIPLLFSPVPLKPQQEAGTALMHFFLCTKKSLRFPAQPQPLLCYQVLQHPVMEISLLCPWHCHTLCTGCVSLICPRASLAPCISALPLSPVSISIGFYYPQEALTACFIFFPTSPISHHGTCTLSHVLSLCDLPGLWTVAVVPVPVRPFGSHFC